MRMYNGPGVKKTTTKHYKLQVNSVKMCASEA